MNFLGMGMPELVVIFLVAFLALGPSKSIEMARTTGRMLGDLRRTFNEVIAATTLDAEDPNSPDSKTTGSAPRSSGSEPKDSSGDSSDNFSGGGRGVGRQ